MQFGNNNVLLTLEGPGGPPYEAVFASARFAGGSPVRLLRFHDMDFWGRPQMAPLGVMLGLPPGLPVHYLTDRTPRCLKVQGWLPAAEKPAAAAVQTGWALLDIGPPGGRQVILRSLDDGTAVYIVADCYLELQPVELDVVVAKLAAVEDKLGLFLGHQDAGEFIWSSLPDLKMSAALAA